MRVCLRYGYAEEFEEVIGTVNTSGVAPDEKFAWLVVQNCTKRRRLIWRGYEWHCWDDRFYYEVAVRPHSS